ncbi:uncharacterized protein LOC119377056 [Rhipicephalus sanguineus]|uniref:uncharacterized protein LOC119377056 n=1 Tax=Rhipicephalus sanguineus TaxID=34632 RepID=UPI0020C2565C|nr:uncharacterized protein LOC119377056 [Rhipicephalus sanguineus]
MQVSSSYQAPTKKSSDYFLVQLPSPQCCLLLISECIDVIRALLLLSGDVETNPGPDKVVLDELRKLSAGQATLISEMQSLKTQLTSTTNTIANLSTRLTDLENHCQNLLALRTEVDALNSKTGQLTHRMCDIEERLDDLENRSRRNNLIFYGFPDTNPKETYAQSEQIIIDHCLKCFGLTVVTKDIERAHRLGRYSTNRKRPIIVKLSSFKTKESILSNGPKLKGTNLSIGEDFTRPVRTARKQLVTFARSKSVPFSLRFKTLHIGDQRYIFDSAAGIVRAVS